MENWLFNIEIRTLTEYENQNWGSCSLRWFKIASLASVPLGDLFPSLESSPEM